MTRVRIENVVASASLGAELDLQKIANALEEADYAPDRFPGLIYRLKEPGTAVLLFHSGKLVCTGGKSWRQIDRSVRIVSELVRKAGEKVPAHPKIQIQNIVATSDLGAELDLNAIAIALGLDRVEYEPEQFPGLVCRLEDPRVVVLLFGSGKLVCTGARRPVDIERAVGKITADLRQAGALPAPRAAGRRASIPLVLPSEPSAGRPRAAPAESPPQLAA